MKTQIEYLQSLPTNWKDMPVSISRCIHCGGITLNAQDDVCACGNELYPVTRIMLPGTTYYPGSSGGDELRDKFEGPRRIILKDVPY